MIKQNCYRFFKKFLAYPVTGFLTAFEQVSLFTDFSETGDLTPGKIRSESRLLLRCLQGVRVLGIQNQNYRLS
ncbi:MAG: hypothetical protein IKX40_08895 [Thermoguttaceae bacterium]|nr:hypothetical protein [Thermoguttaceae bacterium]